MSRVVLDLAGIGKNNTADQLQCAILGVLQVGLLTTMAERSKGRMLLPSR